MATVNKDFKIKQGLVVEGSTATVAGNNILTETASDQYIIDLVGGVAYITSVAGNLSVTDGELSLNLAGIVSDIAGTRLTTDGSTLNVDVDGIADDLTGSYGFATGTDISMALTGYALESFVTGQGYLTSADLSGYATESFVTTQGYLVSSDLSGYVTETGTQTLTNKTIGDTLNFTGAGAMTINSDSHIVLTPATGSSVKWGSDVLATQTYADSAVTAHNDLTTGVHGVTGDVVGTSDTQDISNKRIIDTLYFTDGVTISDEGQIAVLSGTHEFEIKANYGDLTLETIAAPEGVGSNVNISSLYGDIVLTTPAQDKSAYIGSVAPANEIATKSYVDATAQGLDVKASVLLATNEALSGWTQGGLSNGIYYTLTAPTLSASIFGTFVVSVGSRVLVKNQVDGIGNGIYKVTTQGVEDDGKGNGAAYVLTLAEDGIPLSTLTRGSFVFVEAESDAGKGFVCTGINTGNAAVSWTQFSETGNYITSVGTGLDVTGGNLTVVADTFDAYGSAAAITPTSLGLGNVDNTSDANKPVSTATQTALDAKADAANPTLTGSLNLDGLGDFTISADAGIILAATTESYIGSAAAGNIIATEGYVDSAIAGVTVDYAAMAGTYLDWSGTQFNVDAAGLITTEDLATNTSVGTDITTAIDALTTADIEEFAPGGPLYFTDQRALDAVSGSNIQPLSIDINTYRTEEATQQVVTSASIVTAHTFTGNRSVKYLVRTVGTVSGTVHSQVTELLVTVDGNNNVAVTEYGTIYTSVDPLATATMDYDVINEEYRLRVTTAISGAEVVVAATILTWD